jgi:hypothetical protein
MESATLVLIIKSAFDALGDPRFSRSRFDLFRHQFIIASYGMILLNDLQIYFG